MGLRGNEQFAADAVSEYLESLGLIGDYDEGADPPDLVFHPKNSETWGAEVTGLHQHFSYLGRRPQSREAMDSPVRKMCESIRAETSGILTQTYILTALPPVSVPLEEIRKQVLQHITAGTTGTWSLDPDGLFTLQTRDTKPYRLACIHGLRADVRTADNAAVGAAIEANAEWSIDKALSDKCPRMARVTNHSRRLLILVGEYRLASAATVSRILQRKAVAPFDAILYVEWDSSVTVVGDPSGIFP